MHVTRDGRASGGGRLLLMEGGREGRDAELRSVWTRVHNPFLELSYQDFSSFFVLKISLFTHLASKSACVCVSRLSFYPSPLPHSKQPVGMCEYMCEYACVHAGVRAWVLRRTSSHWRLGDLSSADLGWRWWASRWCLAAPQSPGPPWPWLDGWSSAPPTARSCRPCEPQKFSPPRPPPTPCILLPWTAWLELMNGIEVNLGSNLQLHTNSEYKARCCYGATYQIYCQKRNVHSET